VASAYDRCFSEAANTYGVPENLLHAIAIVETGERDLPPSINSDGSYDIGVMRINSKWLKVLGRHGITREALNDRCQNIYVGAWILAMNFAQHGAVWTAVGAYNVGCFRMASTECERRRSIYTWKVYCAMREASGNTMCKRAARYVVH
jgi:soluble lytic murein transglycosylase-like protein